MGGADPARTEAEGAARGRAATGATYAEEGGRESMSLSAMVEVRDRAGGTDWPAS